MRGYNTGAGQARRGADGHVSFRGRNQQELSDTAQGDEADQGAVLRNRYGVTVTAFQSVQHRLKRLGAVRRRTLGCPMSAAR